MCVSTWFIAEPHEIGERIDKVVRDRFNDLTRNSIQHLLESGNIYINGKSVPKNYRLRSGDKLEITIPSPVEITAKEQEIPLDVVFEDKDLIVINKPKGMVVHPAAGNYEGTLVNALLFHCKGSLSGIGGKIRPGIVHRIDKDTSGLLVAAKNDFAHLSLSAQIKAHTVSRIYAAVVVGNIKEDEMTIDAPIGRDEKNRKKMAITSKNGKPAVTHLRVLERFGNYTFCEFSLETGRTHQIRVHCASIGHPIVSDTVYGSKKGIAGIDGQCLHAKKLILHHPKTGEQMEFESELPAYFTSFLKKLRGK